ncbi:hypothetical protein D3C76_1831890 [compost metagenome]
MLALLETDVTIDIARLNHIFDEFVFAGGGSERLHVIQIGKAIHPTEIDHQLFRSGGGTDQPVGYVRGFQESL